MYTTLTNPASSATIIGPARSAQTQPALSRRAALGLLGAAGTAAIAGRALGFENRAIAQATTPATPPVTPAPATPKAPSFSNPTVYRRQVGEIEVYAIADDSGVNPGPLFPMWGADTGKAAVEAALASDLLPPENNRFYFNVTLIRLPGMNLLVDVGNKGNSPSAGQLVRSLSTIGLTPDDINVVVFSHLHPDHFGGLFDGTALSPILAFPKARYFIHKDEVDFWSTATKANIKGKIPDAFKDGMLSGANAALKLLQGKIEQNDTLARIATGLTIEPLPGHTPGHQTVRVASGNEQLLIMADAVHHSSLSFRNPAMQIQFDVDPAVGAKNRLAFVQKAHAEKMLVLGYHMPFPAIGRVAQEGTGYRWVPEGWQW